MRLRTQNHRLRQRRQRRREPRFVRPRLRRRRRRAPLILQINVRTRRERATEFRILQNHTPTPYEIIERARRSRQSPVPYSRASSPPRARIRVVLASRTRPILPDPERERVLLLVRPKRILSSRPLLIILRVRSFASLASSVTRSRFSVVVVPY